jgi:hypothetical protein
LHNAAAFACLRADKDIESRDEGKKLKYKRKANLNLALANMKNRLMSALMSGFYKMVGLVHEILDKAVEEKISIRPGRQFPHKRKNKGLKHPNCQKRAF